MSSAFSLDKGEFNILRAFKLNITSNLIVEKQVSQMTAPGDFGEVKINMPRSNYVITPQSKNVSSKIRRSRVSIFSRMQLFTIQ